ncbi:hypothetical protein ACHAWT_002645 [Skeletonema menzelii]|eukprot:scaffold242_cov148-Skeletonema_menzelii.AAC.18
MSKLLFHLPRPTVPIFTRATKDASAPSWTAASSEFPIRRIYCVGRNYREHAIEMGHNPDRELPFFFQKPADSVVLCYPSSISTVPYPLATSSLHHEAELIIAIAKDGRKISTDTAMDYIYGYSLGCDLTRRDLQAEAKKMGRPWCSAKGFDSSCPLTPIIPKEEIEIGDDTQIQLEVNGTIRQSSPLSKMIYSLPEIVSHLSELFTLQKGDLIMTGTPAGVSELKVGDDVSITCGQLLPCKFVVGPPNS